MSKILLVNGSPHEHGCIDVALNEVATSLKNNGVDSEILWLTQKPMQDCIACGKCQQIGRCVFNDLVNQTAARFDEFDGIVVGSPVHYGGPDGRITSFLTRLFFSMDSKKLQGKIAAAVVSCRRGGATATFQRLNMYFQMTNMVVVTSQYWNLIHGFNAEEARQDIEGLQTMRTLGQNIAWLAKNLGNVELPQYEPKTFTNFIR